MSENLDDLVGQLGGELPDELVQRAVTHRSYAYENGGLPTNERLEFLGDSVLGLVVTEELYRRHPDLPEGQLAKLRAAVVNSRALAEVARALESDGTCGSAAARRPAAAGTSPRSSPTPWRPCSGPSTSPAGSSRRGSSSTACSSRCSPPRPQLGAGLDWKTSLQELAASGPWACRSIS